MRIFQKSLTNFFKFSSTLKQEAGDVYLWSDKSPAKLALPEKARRVSLGQNHNCIVGQSGNLYTFGSNKYGQLGHGDKNQAKTPKLVEYFEKKDIKIKQALCGETHTIALSEDGKVYTFGHGGKRSYFLMNLFVSKASPLGHGNQDSVFTPAKIKAFENTKIERITAGNEFNFATDDKGKIYYWGCGEYGVAGDGSTRNCNVPITNEYFDYLEEDQNLKIKKIKSCGTFSIVLMTDGRLYGWGANHAGQIGVKSQIGIQLHETIKHPHRMIEEGYEDKKVKNFDISENMTIFQLENNQFWWCGKRVAFKPEKVKIEQSQNAKLFAAGNKSFAVVTNNNDIYTLGKFINGQGDEDIHSGIIKIKGESVLPGNIVGIGGEYSQRYAIIV